jgi:excisionase family DNA binding protein
MSVLAEMSEVLTVEEAATVLRIGRSAAYEGVRTGEIPAVKVGRSIRIPRCRLAALLGKNDPTNTTDPAPNPGPSSNSGSQLPHAPV